MTADNLNRLLAVYDLVDRPELKYAPFTPGVPKSLVKTNIFEAISKQDILLHHPFESFAPVIDFIYRAATDPDVLAIKQTLYRTTPDSPLVESLVSAAKVDSYHGFIFATLDPDAAPLDDYLVIAVQNLEPGQFSDPEFLTRAKEEAKSFSLNEGETKAVDVKLSKLVP